MTPANNPSNWKTKVRDALIFWRKIPMAQRLAIIAILFMLVSFPLLMIASYTQTRTRSRAYELKPITLPITPPTSTPSQNIWGNAAVFDVTSGYLMALDSANIDAKKDFSVEAWIKPASVQFGSPRAIVIEEHFSLYVDTGPTWADPNQYIITYLFSADDYNGPHNCSPKTVKIQKTLPASEITAWHHVAGVIRSDGKLEIFADGQRSGNQFTFINDIDTCNLPSYRSNYPVYVGAYYTNEYGPIDRFAGEIDEIRISKIARYYTDTDFTPSSSPFQPDYANDLILYHFDSPIKCNTISNKCYTPNYTDGKYDGEINGDVKFVPSTISISHTPTPTPAITIIPLPTRTPTPTLPPILSTTPSPTTTIIPLPTKTPTPTPNKVNNPPVITTTSLPNGKINASYNATVKGYDKNVSDQLKMTFGNLPNGLSQGPCAESIDKMTQRKNIQCVISGKPQKIGNYNVLVTLSDNRSGIAKKTLKLTVTR